MDRRGFLVSSLGACLAACAGCRRTSELADVKRTEAGVSLACCGIDCTDCGIRLAASDPVKAEQEAEAWRQRGHEDARPGWFKRQVRHPPLLPEGAAARQLQPVR
jgi:hypothetical protein